MNTYNSIKGLTNIEYLNKELIDLLKLLEEVNPCEQRYAQINNSMVVSYKLKVNLFNFFKSSPFYIKTQIIGLPISLCLEGYFGEPKEVLGIIHNKKGLKIVLNATKDLGCTGRTLSTFILYNNFLTFNDYINKMRHPYRRRINKALKSRDNLILNKLRNIDFTEGHYALYKSIMDRTKNPLEILSIEFFERYDSDIYEFLDRSTNRLLGFIQLKEMGDTLYFMFCGFEKDDSQPYDLYYNMLLKIVEEGISRGVKKIDFGQTSEESKSKLGCIEVPKYLGIYHSNRLLNWLFQLLLPTFSYKPYNIIHKVFKEDEI